MILAAKILIVVALVLTVVCSRWLLSSALTGFMDLRPLAFWAGQWVVFWTSAAGVSLGVRTRAPGLLPLLAAGAVAWLFCVLVNLPDFEEMTSARQPYRVGLGSWLRAKLEHRDFRRHHFTVGRDRIIAGVPVKAGMSVQLGRDGRVEELGSGRDVPVTQDGATYARVSLYAGTSRVHEGKLPSDQVVRGYPCRAGGSYWDVELDPDGEPVRFQLSRPHVIAGVTWPADTFVRVAGDVITLWPVAEGVTVQGFSVPRDTWVKVTRDGRLSELDNPYERPVVRGRLRLGRHLQFDAAGRLAEGELAEAVVVGGRTIGKGTRVRFDEAGEPVPCSG